MNSERKYFRLERILLKFGGLSVEPDKGVFYNIYTYFVVFGCHIFYSIMITTAVLTSNSDENVDSGFYLSGTFMASAFVVHTFLNRNRIRHIFDQIESKRFAPSVERGAVEEEEKLIKEWKQSCTVQVALLIVTTMSCITIQVGYTLTKRLNNSDPRNWRLGWAEKSAFMDITRSPNFELMWLYNNFTYFYMCINGSFSVAVVGNCINFVTVQLKILQNFLKRIPEVSAKKARENNDDNISQYWHESLKDGVLFHLTISELTHYIIDTFSASINISMSFTLGLMCFSAYRASMQPLNSIHMLSILMEATSSTLPALIHCVNGEKLIKESTKVGDAVYEMDFVGSDIKFQKKMIVLIRRSQNVISVKAGNVVDVSLELLVRIYRASFSAYMMLRTMNSKNVG